MPRPGPRPYECVRRAWHSERHQPLRGTIIQQIFRLATDAHNPATKKNKEWQEKLPIVVLKAEEIMYSKANSEAEYMDPETLWDRVNDAVNTIIRRDESAETGDLLPPCVEAALNLGCVPVRASRSQRHSNPRIYLNPRPLEPNSPSTLDTTASERHPQLSAFRSANHPNLASPVTVSSNILGSESSSPVTENNTLAASYGYPFFRENSFSGRNPLAMAPSASLNMGSVYPLYYGVQCHPREPQLGAQNPNAVFLGTPIGSPMSEPPGVKVGRNLPSYMGLEGGSEGTPQADFRGYHENGAAEKCDLSLRLGLFQHPSGSMEKNPAPEAEEVESSGSGSQVRGEYGDLSPRVCNDLHFLPRNSAMDLFQSCSKRILQEGEDENMRIAVRKRKASSGRGACWQPEPAPGRFVDHMKGSGL